MPKIKSLRPIFIHKIAAIGYGVGALFGAGAVAITPDKYKAPMFNWVSTATEAIWNGPPEGYEYEVDTPLYDY